MIGHQTISWTQKRFATTGVQHQLTELLVEGGSKPARRFGKNSHAPMNSGEPEVAATIEPRQVVEVGCHGGEISSGLTSAATKFFMKLL